MQTASRNVMKKTLICFVVLLSYAIAVMECGAFGIGNQNVSRVPGKTCVPLSAADLAVSPPDSAPLLPKDIMGKVTISLSSDVKGRLRLIHPHSTTTVASPDVCKMSADGRCLLRVWTRWAIRSPRRHASASRTGRNGIRVPAHACA